MYKKIICCFYASSRYGSEYRSGLEFIKFAVESGFDTVIISDLIENSSLTEIRNLSSKIEVIVVPSPIKDQMTLYRFTDVFAQYVWHYRVAKWLRNNVKESECVWVQNGAAIWLPLFIYHNTSKKIIWGPVGGFEVASRDIIKELNFRDKFREVLRSFVESCMLRFKLVQLSISNKSKTIILARTPTSQKYLSKLSNKPVPVIPEIIYPFQELKIQKIPSKTPQFIWVGQDVPRKNLRLGVQLFKKLRNEKYPNATLSIYGCEASIELVGDGIKFHGWVKQINWRDLRNNGVLLLTSYREGIPSVVLEAVQNGLLCITTDVGSIKTMNMDNIVIVPKEIHLDVDESVISKIYDSINIHLSKETVEIRKQDYKKTLTDFLKKNKVVVHDKN